MSILTLQIGQCGNQLGPTFFDTLAVEYQNHGRKFYDRYHWNPFFRNPLKNRGEYFQVPIARSLLIDMEPAVVQNAYLSAQYKSSKWNYSRQNCFFQQSGSGNNWAMGFNEHGPEVHRSILESIRKELEITDVFGGFLFLHSMAGGTGSGLGAYLTEILSDVYPSNFRLNYGIWPFKIGEVIVQNYNALLTLSHLHDTSHGIFVAENDKLNASIQKLQTRQHRFEDMNRNAMRSLVAALLPSKLRPLQGTTTKIISGDWTRLIFDFLSVLCPLSNQKLLSCELLPELSPKSIDYTVFDWNALIRQMEKTCKRQCKPSKSFSRFITLRGRHSQSPDVHSLAKDDFFVHQAARVGVGYSPVPFGDLEKSISCVNNRPDNARPAAEALSNARRMLKSKAFLHSYAKYGFQRNDFQTAFETVEDGILYPYGIHGPRKK